VTIKDGKISVVKDLEVNDFAKAKLEITKKELLEERTMAFELLGIK